MACQLDGLLFPCGTNEGPECTSVVNLSLCYIALIAKVLRISSMESEGRWDTMGCRMGESGEEPRRCSAPRPDFLR